MILGARYLLPPYHFTGGRIVIAKILLVLGWSGMRFEVSAFAASRASSGTPGQMAHWPGATLSCLSSLEPADDKRVGVAAGLVVRQSAWPRIVQANTKSNRDRILDRRERCPLVPASSRFRR